MCDPAIMGLSAIDPLSAAVLGADKTIKKQKEAFEEALSRAQTPPKPPQATSLPDESARRAAQAVALMGGRKNSTLLTGPSGVSSGGLNLGRNTLLGS